MRGSVGFFACVCLSGIVFTVVASGCGGRRRGDRGIVPNDGGTGDAASVDLGATPDDAALPPDAELSPSCGDGVIDLGEDCDDGGASESCDADCTIAECGDFTVNSARGEMCDDGNRSSGDGCDPECRIETPASCGNFRIDAGEQCDEGEGGSSSCDADCTFVVCGDFTWNALAGEDCDSGGTSNSSCDRDCTFPSCGDGLVNSPAGEACDDGDGASGDGCSSFCTIEASYTCTGEPSFCTRTGGGMIDRSASPGLAIPDNNLVGVSSNISLTGAVATSCVVSSITVDVDITHSYIGDLTVSLTSPSSTTVTLHASTGSTADNIVGNYPTTLTPAGFLSDFSGFSAAGTWTMRVVDGASSDVGFFNSWGLHITCL